MENCDQILNSELERYKKIMELPAVEREKYAAGIAKLEARINQLRDACGMNIDAFCMLAAQALADIDGIEWTDERAEHVGALLDEAGKCYNIGDRAGLNGFFLKIKLYIGGQKDARSTASS